MNLFTYVQRAKQSLSLVKNHGMNKTEIEEWTTKEYNRHYTKNGELRVTQ